MMTEENSQSNRFEIRKVTELLTQLVEIDTCQPEGNELRMVKFIENRYQNTGVLCNRIEHGDNRASLVVKLSGNSDSDSIAFIGHIDTVSCGDSALWSSPPLNATVEKGKLTARGAADMKGGIAAMLLALDFFIQNKQKLNKSILFCFSADEEKDGIGARALIESGLLKNVGGIIICEPSRESLGFCEKGALWVRVLASGVACHASRPELGANALEALITFAVKARSLLDLSQEHRLLGKNTMCVTKLHGGIMTNIVPASASIELDIRTLPSVSHENISMKLSELCREIEASMTSVALQLEIINNRPPVETDEMSDFGLKIQACANKRNAHMEKIGLFFYTDASQLVPALGVPFVIMGPGDDRQAHKTNETIELASVARFADLYTGLIEDHCQ